MKKYDVIIVGAGPAGLFAAYKLAGNGKVLILEKGKDIEKRVCKNYEYKYCLECKPCNITSGVGGAGLFSDGKLNFDYRIGSNLEEIISKEDVMRMTEETEKVFSRYGIHADELDLEKCKELETKAYKSGVRFLPIRQAHVGSDKLPEIIKKLRDDVKARGVEIKCNEEFVDLNNKKEVITDKGRYGYGNLLLALGRDGARKLEQLCKEKKIDYGYQAVDMGFRIEVPALIMQELCTIVHDPKIYVPVGDENVRTFCVCPEGFVVREQHEDYCLVNGHSRKDKKSQNTNFAFLLSKRLKPIKNTNAFARKIAEVITHSGDGKPILQSLGDFRLRRRSTWERLERLKDYIQPTLKDVTPGSIGLALGYEIVVPLIAALEKLDGFIPSIAGDPTLVYSFETKLNGLRIKTNDKLETSEKSIYVAGDVSGISRGITASAASGLLAAEGILKNK